MASFNPYALYVHCDAGMEYDSKSTSGIGLHIEFPDFVDLEPIKIKLGKYVGGNIERYELKAIIKGMEEVLGLYSIYSEKLKNVNAIIITTDRFALNDEMRTSPFRISNLKKENWKTNEERDVKNDDLLLQIDKLRKKISNATFITPRIKFRKSKYNKVPHNLANEGKNIALIDKSAASKIVKKCKRKFDGEEINYQQLNPNDCYIVRIFYKESTRSQWLVTVEFCDSEFKGQKLKIIIDNFFEKKIHLHHNYRIRIKAVFSHHIIIYKSIKEIKNI